MIKFIISCLIIVLSVLSVHAQNLRHCSTMEIDSLLRSNNSWMGSYADHLNKSSNWVDKYKKGSISKTPSVLTIPVIFHIIHAGESVGTGTNISQAMIQSQVDVLNQDFRKMAGTPGDNSHPAGADSEIEFCLATIDPQGNNLAEPGIHRVLGSSVTSASPPYADFQIDSDIKPATGWDRDDYLNVWVADLGGGLLGYAQFPGGPANTDGVVILYNSVGAPPANNFPGPYNMGRTATHEIGHWMNLIHIWGDAFCGDDQCNDTPVHEFSNFGCFTHPKSNTCGTADEMFENYMDYTDDACMNIFTKDQKDRMRACLTTSSDRSPLLNSPACNGGNCAGYNASISPVGPSCQGNDGSAVASGVSGTAPYTYQWSTGATTASISSLSAGSYTVTVTDANNCFKTQTVNLTQNLPLASLTMSPENCSGTCDGSIVLSVTGGFTPYTYAWSNGSSGSNQNNLCSGNYTVTVTDNKGCTSIQSAAVTAGVTILSTSSSDTTTCLQSNGSATVSPSGGALPYTYLWNAAAGAQTTPTANNLYTGVYAVTITDANGCFLVDSVFVDNIGGEGISASSNQSVCINEPLNIYASGGVMYVWNTGETSNNINVLPSQDITYTVTVTDGFNCLIVKTIDIEVNPVPLTQVAATPNGPVCPGEEVTLVATGGDHYQWSQLGLGNGGAVSVFPLSNTTYQVTAYNGGCPGNTESVQVNMITPAPIAAASALFTTVYPGSSVNLLSTGSVGTTYQWDFNGDGFYEYTGTTGNASTSYSATGTFAAVLQVTLNTCSVTDTVWIEVIAPVGISISGLQDQWSIYPNPSNGEVNILVNGMIGRVHFLMYNNLGALVSEFKDDLTPHYQRKLSLTETPAGIYYVRLVFDDYFVDQKLLISK